jgi:hypothetical protein
MGRLDHARQIKLEPERINFALQQVRSLGYVITHQDRTKIEFEFNGDTVQYYPYSGWHSGKTITDGRGWNKLKKQIEP